jgi:hypothetical protein
MKSYGHKNILIAIPPASTLVAITWQPPLRKLSYFGFKLSKDWPFNLCIWIYIN